MMTSLPNGDAAETTTTITTTSPVSVSVPQRLEGKDGTEATSLCELSFSDDSEDGNNNDNEDIQVANQPQQEQEHHQEQQTQQQSQETTTTSPTPIKLSCSSSSSGDDSIELRLKELQLSNDDESMLAAEAFTFASNLSGISTQKSITVPQEGSVIGPRNLMELVSCPCCAQPCTATNNNGNNVNNNNNSNNNNNFEKQLKSSLTTLNEPLAAAAASAKYHHHNSHHHGGGGGGGFYIGGAAESARQAGSLLSDSDDEEDEFLHEPEDVLPGVLAAGVEYSIKRILVEGWLHKKGTGKDWLGSKGWKARWARLCLARVDGYEKQIDVPLLLVSWYPTATLVSTPTVILLDSTVVLAVDIPDNNDNNSTDNKDRWNAHRFEIRHASTRENATMPTTRTFCAPQKARDAWLYAISQALLMHAKQKDRLRKSTAFRTIEALKTIPTSNNHNNNNNNSNSNGQQPADHNHIHPRPTSPVYGEVWTGDRFVTVETRESVSSPVHGRSAASLSSSSLPSCSSPTSSHHRPPGGRGALSPPTSPKLPRPSAASATHGSSGNRRHSFHAVAGKSSD